MSRENEILNAIDELDGFTFQKFARRLLQSELYPDLNPLPEQDDLGQDARSEFPVTELPREEHGGKQLSFAISKTGKWSKVRKDCNRCEEEGHDFDVLVFVTSGEVKGDKRKVWEDRVQDDYGWDLVVRDRTWFSDIATKPENEQLVDQKLGVPPLNGDYHKDILDQFKEFTKDTLSSTESSLPHIDHNIERDRTDTALSKRTGGADIILTGEAGVGKSGVLGDVVRRWNSSPVLFLDARDFSEVSNQTQLRQEFDLNGSLSDAIKRVGQHDGCLLVVDQLDNVSGTPTAGIFVDLLTEAADEDNVSVLTACREWYLDNPTAYSKLVEEQSFEKLDLGELDESTVREVLDLAGISDYSEELIDLGKNLLNLSIILEVHFQAPSDQIDYSQIKSQVELWDHFIDTIPEREREGAEWDRESGSDVRERAVELARQGLKEGSQVVPTSIGVKRAEERLISRNILRRERGERYSFRHQELQNYLYAWNAVERKGWKRPRAVLEEIDERAAAGVFRWMARLWKKEDPKVATVFLKDALAPDGLGYYGAVSLIDEIIDWGPDGLPDDLLDPIIDRIEEREEISRYFYTNLSNPQWARVLHQQDRFEEPVTPILTYLDRVASNIPELTSEIINSTKNEDVRKRGFFLKIAESLPGEYISNNIDVFQDWLYDVPDETRPYTVHYSNLIDELLDGGKFNPALKLINTLLEPQPSDPDIY